MQRWRLWVVALMVGAACVEMPGTKCDESTPCAVGVCASSGYCVHDDGGVGGGTGGGGGMGGGTGGGAGACGGVMCDGGTTCVNNACQPKYSAPIWNAPAEGQSVRAPVGFQVTVPTMKAADLKASLSARVALVNGDGGVNVTLSLMDGGIYTGSSALADGEWRATVGVDGTSLSSSVSFKVDSVGPGLKVTVPAAPYGNDGGALSEVDPNFANAWKRDDKVVLKVEGTEALNAGSLVVSLQGIVQADAGAPSLTALPQIQCPSAVTNCDAPNCFCVEADLAKPVMDAFNGEFKLYAEAKDTAGNAAAGDAGVVRVTRQRWVRTVGDEMRGTPAIGSTGIIYVSTIDGNSGSVIAVNSSGLLKWQSADTGRAESSPIAVTAPTGADVIFVGGNAGGEARLGALNGVDGGVYALSTPYCSNAGATESPPSAALVVTDAGFAAVSVLNDRLCAFVVETDGSADSVRSAPGVPISSAEVNNLTNAIALKNRVVYADKNGNVVAYTFSSLSSWSAQDWSTSLAGSGVIRGLAAHVSVSGGTKIVGGGGPGIGQLFQIDIAGGPAQWRFPATGATAPVWTPAIKDQNAIYFGMETVSGGPAESLRKATQTGIDSLATAVGSPLTGSPLLGDDDRIYTATNAGIVRAHGAQNLAAEWAAVLGDNVRASPALDCNRRRADGPGVLYVATTGGKLHAILVDAKKLSPSAAWPKYQHDSANSGNPDWPLNAGCP